MDLYCDLNVDKSCRSQLIASNVQLMFAEKEKLFLLYTMHNLMIRYLKLLIDVVYQNYPQFTTAKETKLETTW